MSKKLLAYQETDKKLKDIENTLNASEEKKQMFIAYKYISGVSEVIAKLDKTAEDLLNKFNFAIAKQNELNEELKEITAELDEVRDENEANYMLKKVDELLSALKSLEGNIEKINESMAQVKAEYGAIRVKTTKAQEQYKEYAEKFKALQDGMANEIKAINAELAKLKKEIKPELMQKYDAKRKDKIFPILFALSGDKCGNCGMALSMKDISELESGEVVECDNCRALVYKG